MWWVLPGLVVGLVVSSLMIVYWFYHLRSALAKKGLKYTSNLLVLVWIAVFFGSASGLLKMATVIQEGSVIDNMLVYVSVVLYWIALVTLVTGMALDVVISARRAGVGWGWKKATTGGVLSYPISRLGYPVVPLRLYFGLIFLLPFFTFLAIMAHIRFGWFIFHRQLYSILGLVAGIFGGCAEAFFVTKRLKTEVEVVAWFLIPLGLVVWLSPMTYVYLVLGVGELIPFATYFLLPSLAIATVTSGFLFRRFEKREKARVFTFFLGRYVPYPKYWIETPRNPKP